MIEVVDSRKIDALKKRYRRVHPLVFQRSLEYAETLGELFDILETIPQMPITWDAKARSWKTVESLKHLDQLEKILEGPK